MRDEIKGRILCAEDEALLRRDIRDELVEAGYSVVEAADGDDALARIETAAPDLILCDINMPGRDGYELLYEVRQRGPELAETPFVFLTALSDACDVVDGKRAGADDYLVKPIDFDLMLATVDARLRQVGRIRDKHEEQLCRLRKAFSPIGGDPSAAGLEMTARALEPVAVGIVLLSGNGSVLLANRAARQMTDGFMTLREGMLPEPAFGPDHRRLREALERLRDGRGFGNGETEVECLRLARGGERRELLGVICSLRVDGRERDVAPSAVMLISDPECSVRLPEDALARLFDLTPTESRIALSLAEGNPPAAIAQSMGVARTTVTFHLRNVFQKTDTHRQAELVALILAGTMTVSLGPRQCGGGDV